jgi:hypothetical protein
VFTQNPTCNNAASWDSNNPALKILTWNNFPLIEGDEAVNPIHNLVAYHNGLESNAAALSTKLLAMTNPSRPVVDLPVFLFELRELPELINVAGKTLLRTVAKANLSYEFGWRPLISDLLKLFDFHDHVERRYQELKKLYTVGFRKTVSLERNSASSSTLPNALLYYNAIFWTYLDRFNKTTAYECRGHARWKPTTLPPKGDVALRNLAVRACLGLSLSPAALWEAMPWSWLVDWFSSVGDFLNASRNLIPARCTSASLMYQYKVSFNGKFRTDWTSWYNSHPNFKLADSYQSLVGYREIKTRYPASTTPTLTADLQWLTPRQWGILASLSVTKGRMGSLS